MRLRGEHRVQFFLKGRRRADMRNALKAALAEMPEVRRRSHGRRRSAEVCSSKRLGHFTKSTTAQRHRREAQHEHHHGEDREPQRADRAGMSSSTVRG